jgi:hypothetical protein
VSLVSGNLLSAMTFCHKTGEFRKENIGGDQKNFSRRIPIE